MLGSRAAVEEVAQFLRESRCPAVLDPVLLSSSGTPLLPRSALGALCESLIPLVQVLTPNLPEARALLRLRGPAPPARELARQLSDLGAASVVLKGGHSDEDPVCDYYVAAGETRLFRHRRLPYEARGTGCTLASAVAAGLARGLDTAAAVSAAQRYLQRRLRAAYRADRSGVRLLGPLARG